ncbi:MAG: hypothetical protein J6A59_17390 [Lachnospiraceae bacterium]|nr:hypothetical protein [Lachnospiraceae bacterium]MBR3834437.1 hypothetical protein [Lachnospiraceae bacterium]
MEYKKVIRYVKAIIKLEVHNVSVYLLLLSIFLIIQYCFSNVSDYLIENSQSMNFFELYVAFMSTRQSQLIYIVAIILLIKGGCFSDSSMTFYLVRMNKKIWLNTQWIYVFLEITLLNLFIMVCILVASNGLCDLKPEWSDAFLTASQFSPEKIGIRSIVSFSYNLTKYNPNFIGIITFVLSMMIGMVSGITIIYFDIMKKTIVGAITVLLLWFLDVIVEFVPVFSVFEYISYYGLSRIYRLSVNNYRPTIVYSICFFSCSIIILYNIGIYIVKKIDVLKME